MVLRIFETEEAKYYLGLGNHLESSAPLFEGVDFSEIDFLVLENGLFSSEEFLGFLQSNSFYGELYDKIYSENPTLSIYTVDMIQRDPLFLIAAEAPSVALGVMWTGGGVKEAIKKNSRRSFLKILGKTLGGIALVSDPLLFYLGGEQNSLFRQFHSLHTLAVPTPLLGFRDALCAKKVSEYLVHRHWQPERKVNAALVYAPAHSGIELQLQNPDFTDATLELYADILGYASPEELNRVVEIRSEKNGFLVEELDCGLF